MLNWEEPYTTKLSNKINHNPATEITVSSKVHVPNDECRGNREILLSLLREVSLTRKIISSVNLFSELSF